MIAKNGSLCNYALFFSSHIILFDALFPFSVVVVAELFFLSAVEMCTVYCLGAQPVPTQIEGKIEIMFVHNYRECEKATMALSAQMVWTKIVCTKPPIVDLSAHQIPCHNFSNGRQHRDEQIVDAFSSKIEICGHLLPPMRLRMQSKCVKQRHEELEKRCRHQNGMSSIMKFELINSNDVKWHCIARTRF